MISLWLPLWSLIGPDEGLVFLIIVFTFFITISIIVKFRSQSDMSCVPNTHYYVAQECMSLTNNPFQFRLTPLKKQNESQLNDEIGEEKSNKTSDESNRSNDENDSIKKETADKVNKTEINKGASTSSQKTVDDDDNDFKKGIKIDVFCKEDFYLCYYWGVNIDQFHNFMRLNTKSFNDRIFDGTLFEQAYLEKNDPELVIGTDQIKTFNLTCSDKVNQDTLGQSPRTCYPLVVILARNLSKEFQDDKDDKDNKKNQKDQNDVVFMINVIHVKDKICPLETNVITRLLKKRNGMTINLQTLYTPNEFEDETGTNTAICVICQETSVSIALLPCKHTCTCLECFTKIDKCPLCRSYIRSYFVLKFDEKNEQQANNQSQDHSQTSGQTTVGQQTDQNRQNTSFLKKIKNLFKT